MKTTISNKLRFTNNACESINAQLNSYLPLGKLISVEQFSQNLLKILKIYDVNE